MAPSTSPAEGYGMGWAHGAAVRGSGLHVGWRGYNRPEQVRKAPHIWAVNTGWAYKRIQAEG